MLELTETICLPLAGTTQDIKWGHLCFLVGEKIYCMTALEQSSPVIFKVPKEEFDELTARSGIVQAPHFARGQWVSVSDPHALTGQEWEHYLKQSYGLVLSGLSKKLQREILGEESDFS